MSARDDFMDTYFGRDDEVTQGMVNDYLDRIEAEALKEHGLTIRAGRSSDPEPAPPHHSWEKHDDSCECHIGICMECGCTNEYVRADPALQATGEPRCTCQRQPGIYPHKDFCELVWVGATGEGETPE